MHSKGDAYMGELTLNVQTKKPTDTASPPTVTLMLQDEKGALVLLVDLSANDWWDVCTGRALRVTNQIEAAALA